MAKTVGDFLLQRLHQWGIHRIYGYPGDGINGIMAAFARQDRIEFIQARHEELAAFMACAHAKFTGEVGVCMATSGPGAVHLLNGLYDAKMDHQPVVAIVGQKMRMSLGGDFQQEVDLVSLFKDVAHDYVHMATTPEQVRHLIDRAVRIARSERAVTCVIVPSDLQTLDAVEMPPHKHGSVPTGIGTTGLSQVPGQDALQQAADILNAGQKVAILAGAGALHATDELIKVTDLLGAGIAKALLGKAAVPDDLPFVTGSLGFIGTKPSSDMMSACDTLLMIGSSFPYAEFLPRDGQARGVQIEIDGKMAGLRYPMECCLLGDSRETLRALIPLLKRKTDLAWRTEIENSVQNWWRVLQARAMNKADPVNPQRVFWELSARLPDGCILTGDSGSVASWFAIDIKIRRGMMASLSGGLASMGSGVPYAFAAKTAYPDRDVIAVVGDGAMQMNGINTLITIAAAWKQWSNPRLIVLVLNNHDLNFVTWEQRGMGMPKYETSQKLPDFSYAAFARILGIDGILIKQPEQIGPAWDAAMRAGKPCVIEAVVDPSIPPFGPHMVQMQSKTYSEAMDKGDPDAAAMREAITRQGSEDY